MDLSPIHVFVSYSRADQSLVSPIVQIIRAVGVRTFQDVDSIPHGQRWRPIIEDSIDKAETVLVFWCEHSQASDEVRREWTLAVRGEKDIVPALLDDTPLEAQLAEYQGIDLRNLTRHRFGEPSKRSNLLPGFDDLPEDVRRKIGNVEGSQTREDDRSVAAANRIIEFLCKAKG